MFENERDILSGKGDRKGEHGVCTETQRSASVSQGEICRESSQAEEAASAEDQIKMCRGVAQAIFFQCRSLGPSLRDSGLASLGEAQLSPFPCSSSNSEPGGSRTALGENVILRLSHSLGPRSFSVNCLYACIKPQRR